MGESFLENHVDFERRWHTFEKAMWVVLSLLLAGAAAGVFGRGPLAKRESRSRDGALVVEWDRVVRARATAALVFTLEAPGGEVRLKLRDGLATEGALRDISPPPKATIAGREALTLVYDVEPGSAATIRMTQALQKPGLLRSTVEAGGAPVNLEQIVLP